MPKRKFTVGELRQQSALRESQRILVPVLSPELKQVLGTIKIRIVEAYPDTTDQEGSWNSVFKIKLALENEEV
jgi:hypothetical protein